MKANRIYFLILGILLIAVGIVQAVIFKIPHYFTFFSIGMFIILYLVYEAYLGKGPFKGWTAKQHFLFWLTIIAICIFLDRFGMDAHYWTYPHYSGLYDSILKYAFEWAVPFVYLSFGMLIGQKFFMDKKIGRVTSLLLSLAIVVTILGVFTELFNTFVFSWKIESMPYTNAKMGSYFIAFQTFGYWTMALIGGGIRKIINTG